MSLDRQQASVFLVGAGRMGGALLRGWLAAGFPAQSLTVADPNAGPEIAELLKSHAIAAKPQTAPDLMVLAVKPQIMNVVLAEIAPLAGPQTAVLSIAAGRTIASIAAHFAPGTAIVRAMPNLPAEIGRGITAAYANAQVMPERRSLCDALLRAAGEVAWIDRRSFDGRGDGGLRIGAGLRLPPRGMPRGRSRCSRLAQGHGRATRARDRDRRGRASLPLAAARRAASRKCDLARRHNRGGPFRPHGRAFAQGPHPRNGRRRHAPLPRAFELASPHFQSPVPVQISAPLSRDRVRNVGCGAFRSPRCDGDAVNNSICCRISPV